MICRKCGVELPENSIFCNMCGAKQTEPTRSPKKRGNGQGSVYKRGTKYIAQKTQYVLGERKVVRKGGFERKKDALAWLESQRSSISSSGSQTLAKLYAAWLESYAPKISESKQTAYKIAFKRIERISTVDIASLSIEHLQGCIYGLNYYPARDVKVLLSHLYKRACAQGNVPANLATFMELPKLQEKEAEHYTIEEVSAMWKAYEGGDTFAAFPLMMIHTGMMPGELLQCKKDMIDLAEKRIVCAGKKTQERKVKAIVLPDIIVPLFQAQCESHDGKMLVNINRDAWYAEYKTMSERIGIRVLPPYACRHTAASIMANDADVAPALISKAMRHKKSMTTERYKHAEETQIRDALNKAYEGIK